MNQTESEINNSNLNDIKNTDDVPYFNFDNKTFIAKPCNVYDGDTFSVVFDFKGEFIKYRCRCYGYDTPEMRPSLKKPNRIKEKELANSAKNRFIQLLESHPSKLITIQCLKFDKYGRILVKVFNNVNDKSINDIMVEEGHGKLYDGGKKNNNW